MNKREIRIITAAYLFMQEYTASEIADIMNVSERQIYRHAKTELWDITLEKLGYTGEKSLRKLPARDRERESGDQIAYAHEVYTQIIKEGCKPHNAASLTAKQTDIPVSRIREWRRRFGWRETD